MEEASSEVSDDDLRMMGCTREQFVALRPWKQRSLRRLLPLKDERTARERQLEAEAITLWRCVWANGLMGSLPSFYQSSERRLDDALKHVVEGERHASVEESPPDQGATVRRSPAEREKAIEAICEMLQSCLTPLEVLKVNMDRAVALDRIDALMTHAGRRGKSVGSMLEITFPSQGQSAGELLSSLKAPLDAVQIHAVRRKGSGGGSGLYTCESTDAAPLVMGIRQVERRAIQAGAAGSTGAETGAARPARTLFSAQTSLCGFCAELDLQCLVDAEVRVTVDSVFVRCGGHWALSSDPPRAAYIQLDRRLERRRVSIDISELTDPRAPAEEWRFELSGGVFLRGVAATEPRTELVVQGSAQALANVPQETLPAVVPCEICVAAMDGDVARVTAWLDANPRSVSRAGEGASVNMYTDSRGSLLWYAAVGGQLGVVDALLARGAAVNTEGTIRVGEGRGPSSSLCLPHDLDRHVRGEPSAFKYVAAELMGSLDAHRAVLDALGRAPTAWTESAQ